MKSEERSVVTFREHLAEGRRLGIQVRVGLTLGSDPDKEARDE